MAIQSATKALDIENNVSTRVTNCFSAHERVILVVISRVAKKKHSTERRNKFLTRVHTLFYFLHDITNPKLTIKTTIFTHHPRVSLARFSFCWWRHNQLLMTSQWPDNCDAISWILISNSLDIDFIHGDIHDRSCKKWWLVCEKQVSRTGKSNYIPRYLFDVIYLPQSLIPASDTHLQI